MEAESVLIQNRDLLMLLHIGNVSFCRNKLRTLQCRIRHWRIVAEKLARRVVQDSVTPAFEQSLCFLLLK